MKSKEQITTTIVWDKDFAKAGKSWDKADYDTREKMLNNSVPRLHRDDCRNMILLKFVHLPYEIRRRLKLKSMGVTA